MLINADATLYHRIYNTIADTEIWERKELKGIAWQDRRAVSTEEGGLVSADLTSVFIPRDVGLAYKKPKDYIADDASSYTVDNGDIIVRGLLSYEISSANSVSKLQASHDDVMTVTSVKDRMYGSAALQHIELEVK